MQQTCGLDAIGMKRAALFFAVLLALALFASIVCAQGTPKVTRLDSPKQILFVGNSFNYYNNSLHGHVRSLVGAADRENAAIYAFKSMTISGANLIEHADALPGIVKSRKWDVVILQGNSAEPMDSDKKRSERFKSTVREFDKVIRASGARTVLFMTWAYQDKPEMTQPLADGYLGIANEIGALVVPVGLAFERALKARPGVILHHSDKQHPSLAGTYLAACVFYSALFGRSPAGIEYTADLSKDVAAFLQDIAWATVEAYYRRR
jgi:hypothetical protein